MGSRLDFYKNGSTCQGGTLFSLSQFLPLPPPWKKLILIMHACNVFQLAVVHSNRLIRFYIHLTLAVGMDLPVLFAHWKMMSDPTLIYLFCWVLRKKMKSTNHRNVYCTKYIKDQNVHTTLLQLFSLANSIRSKAFIFIVFSWLHNWHLFPCILILLVQIHTYPYR